MPQHFNTAKARAIARRKLRKQAKAKREEHMKLSDIMGGELHAAEEFFKEKKGEGDKV